MELLVKSVLPHIRARDSLHRKPPNNETLKQYTAILKKEVEEMEKLKEYKGRIITVLIVCILVMLCLFHVHTFRDKVSDYLSQNYEGTEFEITSISFSMRQKSLVANVTSEPEGTKFKVIPFEGGFWDEYIELKYNKLIKEEIEEIIAIKGLEQYMLREPTVSSLPYEKDVSPPPYNLSLSINNEVTDDMQLASISAEIINEIMKTSYSKINVVTVFQDKSPSNGDERYISLRISNLTREVNESLILEHLTIGIQDE